jgi:hypothetical protein
MTISILIPVFDFDIVALVHCMKDGIEQVPEFCEIIIGDDGSSEEPQSGTALLLKQRVIFSFSSMQTPWSAEQLRITCTNGSGTSITRV